MSLILKCWFLLVAAAILNSFIKCDPNWTFEFISVDTVNHTPNISVIDLYISHPSRGVSALSGVIDYKVDASEYSIYYLDMHYSWTGSNFVRTPFHIPRMKLADIMNTFYKDLLMESAVKCCENAPEFEGKFVPPLTKRTIRFNDCIISNKNMPSRMRSGFYKVIIYYTGQGEGHIEFLIKIENDNIIL